MAKQNGGDLLSFDNDIDRLIFELDYSYVLEDIDTKTVDGAMVEAYSGLQSLVNDVSDLAFLSTLEHPQSGYVPENPRARPLPVFSRSLSSERL